MCGGEIQAENLIKIFKKYKITKEDWIFCTWRNSWHWLLSGRNEDDLIWQIQHYGGMHIYDSHFFTSAIVGGIAPIATGVALALKLKKSKRRVFCFVGDMSATTGIFSESVRYSTGHDLPIIYIVEDNKLSVITKTQDAWGKKKKNKVIRYNYKRVYPHSGTGTWVIF